MARVDVGFAEFCEAWELQSRLFPCKIGGKPAWLDLDDLPRQEELQCEVCKGQLTFLLQIYAPFDDPDNFHRTIFVFICRNATCNMQNDNKNVRVFRSALKRENKFYSYEPPIEQPDPTFSLDKFVSLCQMCGCPGSKRCSKCKKVVYCSREHQVIDWKEKHKHSCQNSIPDKENSSWLYPEMNIVIDEEELPEKTTNEDLELQIFEKLKEDGKIGTLDDISEKELDAHASIDKDKAFTKFKERISHFPDQVIRYEKGGMPLWISESPKPDLIPNCEVCKSPRQFEFQIMPQILTLLKEDTVDFGIIAVYTCKNSCTTKAGYKTEFVFKQDVSNESIIEPKELLE